MANQRTTFAKRQREQNKKDKHLAKQARLAKQRAEAREVKDAPPDGANGDVSALDGAPPSPSVDLPTDS